MTDPALLYRMLRGDLNEKVIRHDKTSDRTMQISGGRLLRAEGMNGVERVSWGRRLTRVRETTRRRVGQQRSSGGDCAGLQASVCIMCQGMILDSGFILKCVDKPLQVSR